MLLVRPGGWAATLCIYIKQGEGLDFYFFSVQQEIAGIVTYLARWPTSWGPRNIEDLASPKASVLHTACKHPGLRAWWGSGSQ